MMSQKNSSYTYIATNKFSLVIYAQQKVESAIDELHGTTKRQEGPVRPEGRYISPPRTPTENNPRPRTPSNEAER